MAVTRSAHPLTNVSITWVELVVLYMPCPATSNDKEPSAFDSPEASILPYSNRALKWQAHGLSAAIRCLENITKTYEDLFIPSISKNLLISFQTRISSQPDYLEG